MEEMHVVMVSTGSRRKWDPQDEDGRKSKMLDALSGELWLEDDEKGDVEASHGSETRGGSIDHEFGYTTATNLVGRVNGGWMLEILCFPPFLVLFYVVARTQNLESMLLDPLSHWLLHFDFSFRWAGAPMSANQRNVHVIMFSLSVA